MSNKKSDEYPEPEPLLEPIVEEVWLWNGDLELALSITRAEPEEWLFERGVLMKEDDHIHGVKDLLQGDVVYRLRKRHAIDGAPDPRAELFDWALCSWYSGEVAREAAKGETPPDERLIGS